MLKPFEMTQRRSTTLHKEGGVGGRGVRVVRGLKVLRARSIWLRKDRSANHFCDSFSEAARRVEECEGESCSVLGWREPILRSERGGIGNARRRMVHPGGFPPSLPPKNPPASEGPCFSSPLLRNHFCVVAVFWVGT